jgi:hypothetical protein
VAAKIAKGEVVHVDASLIRADVSWESLAVRHVDALTEANGDEASEPPADPGTEQRRRYSKKTGRFKKVCVTDPDASMATNGRNRRLEPSYKQHAVVDDIVPTPPKRCLGSTSNPSASDAATPKTALGGSRSPLSVTRSQSVDGPKVGRRLGTLSFSRWPAPIGWSGFSFRAHDRTWNRGGAVSIPAAWRDLFFPTVCGPLLSRCCRPSGPNPRAAGLAFGTGRP